MFKIFTERERDIDDCMSLAEVEIRRGSMIEEIKQINKLKNEYFDDLDKLSKNK